MSFTFIGNILQFLFDRSYGRTNQRLGQLLIDITATFEDEFHEFEVRFIYDDYFFIFSYLVNPISYIDARC